MASVKVAVRVRPFNGRERQLDSSLVVKMTGTIINILSIHTYNLASQKMTQKWHIFFIIILARGLIQSLAGRCRQLRGGARWCSAGNRISMYQQGGELP